MVWTVCFHVLHKVLESSLSLIRLKKHNHDSMHILKAGEYLISSDAVLSSALARMQLFRRPESKNIPVDFSSIPAISLQEKKKWENLTFILAVSLPCCIPCKRTSFVMSVHGNMHHLIGSSPTSGEGLVRQVEQKDTCF